MFECQKCQKCFDFRSEYERHISTRGYCEIFNKVTIESSHECKLCKKPYASQASLIRHVKTIHVPFQKMKNLILSNQDV